MNHPPSQIILQWLRTAGLVFVPQTVEPEAQDWPGFRSLLPDVPDNAVAVYDTGGLKDGRLLAAGEVIIHPSLNFRVRARDYAAGWRKADTILIALDGILPGETVLIDGTTYSLFGVSRLGGILPNGLELEGARRRHIFTFNCQLTIRQE